MLRIGSMNMALHGVEGAHVSSRDSLAGDHAEDAGRYSLVLLMIFEVGYHKKNIRRLRFRIQLSYNDNTTI